MSFSPENKSEAMNQIDTASPAAKIAKLKEQIAATVRGIKLASSLNDPVRIKDLETKKAGFEATLNTIDLGDTDFDFTTTEVKAPEVKKPYNRFDVADMSDIDTTRLDARGNI